MWASFIDLWGECATWPIISGNDRWIDQFYDQRVEIAHGLMDPHIKDIEKILEMNDQLQAVSHNFIHTFLKIKKTMTYHQSFCLITKIHGGTGQKHEHQLTKPSIYSRYS